MLQPDSAFIDQYNLLAKYDEGKSKSRLTGRDSVSWGEKSWVVGVQVDSEARAYDWIELMQTRVVNDKINRTSLVIVVEPDSATFHVWERPDSLVFYLDNNSAQLTDDETKSEWDWTGTCKSGPLAGQSLKPLQSYQEYWHSWKTFRPLTSQFKR